MKITFLLPGRGFSGGIRCGTRMASELSRRGHDVRILYRRETLTARSIARNLYKGLVVRAPRDWIGQFNGKCTPYKKLTAELVGKRDVLIAIGPDTVEEMVRMPDECGCKVFYAHGLTLRDIRLRETAWNREIPKIAVSNYVREEMSKSGINNICAVVSNGIDTSEYFPEWPEADRKAVGSIYGRGFAKDPATITSVFSKLHQLRPGIPLVCFGGSSRPKELIQAVQYKLLPTVREARRLFSQCAVWYCASRSEGFGLPVLEAMACGCAVVTTECGGPNDYLETGVNGIAVKKKAPEEMAKEIVKILDDTSKRIRLADEAIKTAQRLSWSSAALQMEKVLQDVLSGLRENRN